MSAKKAIEFIPQKWVPLLIGKLKNYYLVRTIIFLLCLIIFVSNSWLVLLSVLELTIMLLIFLRLQPLRRDNLLLFRYFMFQTLARLCLVSFFLGIFRIHLAWVVLIIKLILPPFHIWLLISMKFGDRKTFYWVMIIIKLPVMIMLIMLTVFFIEEYGKILLLIIWRGAISLFLLWRRGNFLYFLMSSSFLHTLWRILRLLVNKNMFFCYYFFYSLVLFRLITSIYGRFEFLLSNEWRWDIYFRLFIFSGAPPSFMFLIKWRLLFSLIELNIFIFTVFLVISGFSLYLYFRIIFVILLRGVERFQIFKKSKIRGLIYYNLIGLVVWVVLFQLS